MKINTKKLIAEKSRRLFNEFGIYPMTTNHIAKELNISPGNLYYHFKNKEEIIRYIFEEMRQANFALWQVQAHAEMIPSPVDYLNAYQKFYWDYRFFFRELYPLLQKDSILSKAWRQTLKTLMEKIRTTYLFWVQQGLMRDIKDQKELETLAETVLMVSTSFLSYFENKTQKTHQKSFRTSLPHIISVLMPYATPLLQKELKSFLTQKNQK